LVVVFAAPTPANRNPCALHVLVCGEKVMVKRPAAVVQVGIAATPLANG
jgi:hypothetical protein